MDPPANPPSDTSTPMNLEGVDFSNVLAAAMKQVEEENNKKKQTTNQESNATSPPSSVNVNLSSIPTISSVNIPTTPQAITPLDKLKSDLQSWINSHPAALLAIINVKAEEFSMEFTIGPQHVPFQVIFNDSWKPMVSISKTTVTCD